MKRLVQGEPMTTGDLVVATNGVGEVFVSINDGKGGHEVRIWTASDGKLRVVPWPQSHRLTIEDNRLVV